jgi:hypothetical protein
MKTASLESALSELKSRQNADGGFSFHANQAVSRVDATAWAVLALRSHGSEESAMRRGIDYLSAAQGVDGHVGFEEEVLRSIWPTYVAAWAVSGLAQEKDFSEKAMMFILNSAGFTNRFQSWQVGHDLSIKGWSWIENNYGWVEPTVLALLALRSGGYQQHPRYLEGVRFLKNRELSSGGWNVGTTVVFGMETRPACESTAMAMCVLEPLKQCRPESREYLKQFIHDKCGSLTLAWALMAMGEGKDLDILDRVLAWQKERGYAQTEWLSLLCLAWSVLEGQPQSLELGFPRKRF